MKVLPLAARNDSRIAFKRRLTSNEEKEMMQITKEAKDLLGNTGNSVLILHDACLPLSEEKNVGVANLLSKDAESFFDFAKTYFGVNTIQVFPQGEFVRRKHKNGLVCPYSYSALGLNDSLIDLETLTHDSWRKILLPKEFVEVVKANDAIDKNSLVNFENINDEESVFQKNLRLAFDRFVQLKDTDELKVEFEAFKAENNDWLEPKAIYSILQKQNNGKHHDFWLYGRDTKLYDNRVYKEKFLSAKREEYLEKNQYDAEFYKFKQFVADKHLAQARENLHAKGLQLFRIVSK